ncbi:MAG: RNase J family beta-CASP ribonuclease [Candidatus Pacearchaeota archaeon]
MIKIYAVGGYNEVGKNMTIVDLGEDAIIFDCGLYLPPIVELEEREGIMNEKTLRELRAIPDDHLLDKLEINKKVRAILISHAHLDHVGAVPFIANRYPNAEIISTPFTIEVLKSLIIDSNIRIKNRIKQIQSNSSYVIKGKKDYLIEFIHITHSTLQCSIIALHTPDGIIVYANDFKFDNNPQIGERPNYEALKRISKKGIKVLIVESTYADTDRKTPSEKVAKSLLEDVMLGFKNKNSAIIVTTFSSHIARLKSIVELSEKLNRQCIFIGRSLNKYVKAAINVGLCPFKNKIKLISFRNRIDKELKKVNQNKKNYVIVCTGHQGEPGSILDRISRNQFPLRLNKNDHVIFSSSVIPTEINKQHRQQIEKRLKNLKVRIFDNVHVSGHAGREDLRDFISILRPQNIIPAHGDIKKTFSLAELAEELGYKKEKNCYILCNGKYISL